MSDHLEVSVDLTDQNQKVQFTGIARLNPEIIIDSKSPHMKMENDVTKIAETFKKIDY